MELSRMVFFSFFPEEPAEGLNPFEEMVDKGTEELLRLLSLAGRFVNISVRRNYKVE